MKAPTLTIAVCLASAVVGCGASSSGPPTTETAPIARTEPKVHLPQGPPPRRLVVKDLIEGSGHAAERGDQLTVEYIGDFYYGRRFTNSWERTKPFVFRLGDRSAFVDPSWQKGLLGMRLGGRRELIVPPSARGAPPGTPPSATLVYVIDLVAVKPK